MTVLAAKLVGSIAQLRVSSVTLRLAIGQSRSNDGSVVLTISTMSLYARGRKLQNPCFVEILSSSLTGRQMQCQTALSLQQDQDIKSKRKAAYH